MATKILLFCVLGNNYQYSYKELSIYHSSSSALSILQTQSAIVSPVTFSSPIGKEEPTDSAATTPDVTPGDDGKDTSPNQTAPSVDESGCILQTQEISG